MAIVVGEAQDYVPPPDRPERLGFERVGTFRVGDWPGAILARPL
jgi:hypothetical protein